jgi:hypothetical protein
MELKDYIRSELDNAKRGIERVLNTLTKQELNWRPACGCNSIGLILFHVARSEDSLVQATLRGKPQLWESEKWYQKLNMAEGESGSRYTVDQVNSFAMPELKDLQAYYDAVRAKTLEYITTLPLSEFDKKVKLPFGEFSVAGVFSIVASHTTQHTGEMSYARGLLKGMDK